MVSRYSVSLWVLSQFEFYVTKRLDGGDVHADLRISGSGHEYLGGGRIKPGHLAHQPLKVTHHLILLALVQLFTCISLQETLFLISPIF